MADVTLVGVSGDRWYGTKPIEQRQLNRLFARGRTEVNQKKSHGIIKQDLLYLWIKHVEVRSD